ncbi:uncharacterized protein LOC116300445 [Actinia tenebrosa]|uniref:Uncharacterized protein LOC116300445 n=1 Tax=Actinia tenebrosa TaxID=6105 RepID=A0A6P8ICC3_ACTTE|nr:uncharacterized protein LOC116300445 [Actinia tenebrosa]
MLLKQELSIENFKLSYKRTNDFVESKWFPVQIVIVYRGFLALVCLTWIAYAAATSPINVKTFFYLTNWTYTTITTYFILSTTLTILHYTQGTKKHQHHRLINQPELYSQREKEQDTDDEVSDEENNLKWYHRFVWILLNISSNMSLCIVSPFVFGL